MSEADGVGDLPRWSGEAVPVGTPAEQPTRTLQPEPIPAAAAASAPPPKPKRGGLGIGLILGLLGGLMLAGVAIGAYWLGTQQGDETATSDVSTIETEALGGEAVEEDAVDGSDDPASPSIDDADGADETDDDATSTTLEVEAGGDDAAAPSNGSDGAALTGEADGQLILPDGFVPSDPNYEMRIQETTEYAVVRGGKVYLYGFTTDQASLDQAVAVTEGVMGPDGYVVERVVDPDAPETPTGSIFVDDKVLFGFNSTELEPASLPVLDLGIALMLQNPTAEMLIIARSDAIGSADSNLAISRERGEAVVAYWEASGVERSRMTIDARGEADASDSDDEETAALNRSVEFVVSNINPEE